MRIDATVSDLDDPVMFHARPTAIAAATLLAADAAWTCSYDVPSLYDLGGLRGARDAYPTNVVWLLQPMTPDAVAAWWIRREGGVDAERLIVAFDADATRLAPREDLVAGERYELVLVDEAALAADPSLPATQEAQLAFGAEDGADDDAPAPPVATAATEQRVGDMLLSSSMCGPVEAATVARFVVEPDDDTAYVMLERDDGETRVFVRSAVVDAAPDPARLSLIDIAVDEAGAHDYIVTAFDRAGNASAPTVVPVDLGCPGACASTSSAPVAGLALVLVASRRRRRA